VSIGRSAIRSPLAAQIARLVDLWLRAHPRASRPAAAAREVKRTPELPPARSTKPPGSCATRSPKAHFVTRSSETVLSFVNSQPLLLVRRFQRGIPVLKTLSVEHFRSIGRVNLTLTPIMVLVGPNAVGKSNIVDAFRFLRDIATLGLDRSLALRGGIDNIRQRSPTRPYHITFDATIVDDRMRGNFKYTLILSSKTQKYLIIAERLSWQDASSGGPPSRRHLPPDRAIRSFDIARDKHGSVNVDVGFSTDSDTLSLNLRTSNTDESLLETRSLFAELEGAIIATEARSAHRQRPDLLSAIFFPIRRTFLVNEALRDMEAYNIFPNILRNPQNPTNDERLNADASNFCSVFRAFSRDRSGRNAMGNIIDHMRVFLPTLINISIDLVGSFLTPIFHFDDGSRTYKFNTQQLSDGTLRLLGILTALYQPRRPKIIALEEPEQTIHPGLLGIVADAIKHASRSSSVIVTTHSPNLIDYFSPDEIIPVHATADGTTLGSIDGPQLEAIKKGLFSPGELLVIEGLGP
jgi:predicted ATPase